MTDELSPSKQPGDTVRVAYMGRRMHQDGKLHHYFCELYALEVTDELMVFGGKMNAYLIGGIYDIESAGDNKWKVNNLVKVGELQDAEQVAEWRLAERAAITREQANKARTTLENHAKKANKDFGDLTLRQAWSLMASAPPPQRAAMKSAVMAYMEGRW